MKNFIILLLFAFAVSVAIAAPLGAPPDNIKTEQLCQISEQLPDPAYCNYTKTEPTAFTAKFRSLRLTWFLWKEQLRANKHEMSHNAAKSLRFNRNKEVNHWDFTEDLKRKYNASKTFFEAYTEGATKIIVTDLNRMSSDEMLKDTQK